MFLKIGTPKKLTDINFMSPAQTAARHGTRIAVIDDDPFLNIDALRASGFNLIELGDIKSIDSITAYSVIICDIKGVGASFGSKFEGAHVISEIRQAYPDKYIIAFTGMIYNATYNVKLAKADFSATKDIDSEAWTKILDIGISEVTDPTKRWLRFRNHLLEKGMDLYDVFCLEQSFIKSIQMRNSKYLEDSTSTSSWSKETKDLITSFAATAVAQLIQGAISS